MATLYKYLISYNNFKKQLEHLVLYHLTFQGEREHQLLLNAIAFAAQSNLLLSKRRQYVRLFYIMCINLLILHFAQVRILHNI